MVCNIKNKEFAAVGSDKSPSAITSDREKVMDALLAADFAQKKSTKLGLIADVAIRSRSPGLSVG